MLPEKEELVRRLSDAVAQMDEQKTIDVSNQILELGVDPHEAIEEGLRNGLLRARELFEKKEYRFPELLACRDAMQAGLTILEPRLETHDRGTPLRAITGVLVGDANDMGKALIGITLESAGLELIDLGREVTPERFVVGAVETGTRIIILSGFTAAVARAMRRVVEVLSAANLRDRFKVIVAGSLVSSACAEAAGADAHVSDASELVAAARRLATEPSPDAVCSPLGGGGARTAAETAARS